MKAYEVLQNCQNPSNRYKLASLCLKLHRYTDAENALLNKKYLSVNPTDGTPDESQIPNGAAGYYLLGLIYQKDGRSEKAVASFSKALDIDPTLWCAFEKLAESDHKLNLSEIFNSSKAVLGAFHIRLDQNAPFKQCNNSELINAYHGVAKVDLLMKTPYGKGENPNETKENVKNAIENKAFISSPIHERDSEDLQEHHTPTGSALNPNYVTPTAGKNSRRLNAIGSQAPHQLQHESRLSGISSQNKVRDITDNSADDMNSAAGYNKPIGSGATNQEIRPFKMTTSPMQANQSNSKSSYSSKVNKSRDDDGPDLMWLFRKLGSAYIKQIKYECLKAIEAYGELPESQYRTGWVLTQVG